MANPQLEDGFTRIANEIIDVLAKTYMSSYESQVVWFVLRKTYGFNGKKYDWIANSQVVVGTGIHKAHISRTLKKLIRRKIVTQIGNKIGFQKDYDLWLKLPKQVTTNKVTQIGNTVTQIGNKKLPKQADTKEKKETITKETNTHTIKTSRNSLTACTDSELQEIAHSLQVSLEAVERTHRIILNKIEAKEFKGRTVYLSLRNWVDMGIERGTIHKIVNSNYKLLKTV